MDRMMVDPDDSPNRQDHHVRMMTEQNKALAHAFFARFSASDLDGALATMTDDATWLIPGKRDRMPTAGLYTKERIARLFRAMLNQLKGGLRMTVLSAIAEGDRVALEVESNGDLQNGRLYRQQYHFLLEFRDGRICAVREYLDTQHAHDVWIAAASTEGRPR
jgi:ketosteroid isomerase-like protein